MEVGDIAKLAEEQQARETANDPLVKKMFDIVRAFIQTHRVMCYGGTAINNLLPREDQFYDPEVDIPDYDFFSETPQLHAASLADKLVEAGFKSVEAKPGVHLGTFKVFCDYIGVADISHMDKSMFEKIWKDSVLKDDIHYVSPNFLRMAVYLELSRPKGDVSRWKKVYDRLQLLNKHYPITCPASEEKLDDEYLTEKVRKDIKKLLIKEKVILLGFNASMLQGAKKSNKWMLPLDILTTPERMSEIAHKIKNFFGNHEKVSIHEHPAYEEYLPASTDISDKGNTLVRIYETTACHSYHSTRSGLMVASIPTLLQFFFALVYSPREFSDKVPEQRLLCTAEHLVNLANDNSARRHKILTPITCLGKQKSLVDMRVERSELFQKLSEDKTSREFLEYFFEYRPSQMTKTVRRRTREMLRKTLKNRRR